MRTTVKDVNWQDQQALWFAGLKPVAGERSLSKKLPENYLRIVEQAIQLKKEVTRRSVEQINFILEQEKRESSSKRFCKPHRMMLLQGDIKYGCKLPIGKNGAMVQTYLSSAIDDHSRYVIQSQFYDNQEESIVEDTFRKVILKAGKFDTAYFDNGSQYVAKQLKLSLAKLGITVRHAPVRSGKSKGKMEKFHQVADAFLREVKIHKIKTLEELNSYWGMYLEEYYHKTSHEGIRDELEDVCCHEVPQNNSSLSLRCLSQSGNIPVPVLSAPSADSGLSSCQPCGRWAFLHSYSPSVLLPFNISIGRSAGIAP